MESQILQITIDTWQGILGIIVIIFGIGITWGTWKTKVEMLFKLVADIKDDIKDVKEDIKNVKDDIKDVKSSLYKHDEELAQMKIRVHAGYGITNSPTVPNEAGKNLLANSRFNEIYPQIREQIFQIMDELGTRTLYDAEQNAGRALNQLKDSPLMDPLKEHAVNNPTEPLVLIFTVAAWIIRDDYWLEKHPAALANRAKI